jgi:hypothetical protein
VGGLCEHSNDILDVIKGSKFYDQLSKLLACQEEALPHLVCYTF